MASPKDKDQCVCRFCESRILEGFPPVDDAGKEIVSFVMAERGDVEGPQTISYGEYSLEDNEHPAAGFVTFFEQIIKDKNMMQHMVNIFTTTFRRAGDSTTREPMTEFFNERDTRTFFKDIWIMRVRISHDRFVAHNHVTGETTPLIWAKEKNGDVYADPRLKPMFDSILIDDDDFVHFTVFT